VCGGGPLLIRTWMQQVRELNQSGVEIIWVTSGAIASAAERIGFAKSKRTLPEKQALSAIGQPLVMEIYLLACAAQSLRGSQVLLTASDVKDKARRTNLQNTLHQLLQWDFLPILNENDAVATEEIRFGDNDTLAASVATMMQADRLVLLTDVEGLYDKDPKKTSAAQLIPHLAGVKPQLLKSVKTNSLSTKGTGGMYSKLLAARAALKKEIPTHLLRGDLPHNLLRLFRGEPLGTVIGNATSKRWSRP